MQWESVQSAHDEAVFDRPEIDQLLRDTLGFSYREFLGVRDAIRDRYRRLATRARDESGEIVRRAKAEDRDPTPEEITAVYRDVMDLAILPAERAAFNAQDIVADSSLPMPVVEAVLKAFSIGFDASADPVSVISRFLHGGANPLATTSLVTDADGNYVQTAGVIGADSFRTVVEKTF